MISAKIIADSITPSTNRLTTFVVTFPRIVLAEFNTHRMISKNSASSRAIPFHKMLQMVQENPFIPLRFQKEHKGMQGTDYFSVAESHELRINWLKARNEAVDSAVRMSDLGVTKQLCNRILEPFMYHTVICTATDWSNFFALRAHDQAEIHIADLAYQMLEVYNNSEPKKLKVGEWHIPFGNKFDEERIKAMLPSLSESDYKRESEMLKVKIATARCARVSYMNFEGKDDYEADLKLYKVLSESGHWSPFEHCAKADHGSAYVGNFRGYTQLRKIHYNENKTDLRVHRKFYAE